MKNLKQPLFMWPMPLAAHAQDGFCIAIRLALSGGDE